MAAKNHPTTAVSACLKAYIARDGNLSEAARAAGVTWSTANSWAKAGDWPGILRDVKAEVEAGVAAQAVQEITNIRTLALNIQYETLVFIYRKVKEAGEDAFPFDPVKLAESMAKITGAGTDLGKKDAGQFEVVDAAGTLA